MLNECKVVWAVDKKTNENVQWWMALARLACVKLHHPMAPHFSSPICFL